MRPRRAATAILLLIAAIINVCLFAPAQAEIRQIGNDFDQPQTCVARAAGSTSGQMRPLKESSAGRLSPIAGRVLTDHSRMSTRKEFRKSFTNCPALCLEKPPA